MTARPATDLRPGILANCRERQVEHARTWPPAEEASLRAAFGSIEYAKHKTFEEAMQIPALAIAIRNVAHSMSHTAGKLFGKEAKT